MAGVVCSMCGTCTTRASSVHVPLRPQLGESRLRVRVKVGMRVEGWGWRVREVKLMSFMMSLETSSIAIMITFFHCHNVESCETPLVLQ